MENPTKKSKRSVEPLPSSVMVRFADRDGLEAGAPVDIPFDSTSKQLELLINSLLSNTEQVNSL